MPAALRAIGEKLFASVPLTEMEQQALKEFYAGQDEAVDGAAGAGYDGEKRVISFIPTVGINIESTPGKTTTILGRYASDTRFIIEELGLSESLDFSGNPGGFNLLNTPPELYVSAEQFWVEYNKPFLDAAIKRRDEMLMVTPITYDNLYLPGTMNLTGYGREYYYLLEKGYTFYNGKMIPKGG